MKLDDPNAYITATEFDVMERCLPLEDATVLELGCGRARITRLIAERYRPAAIIATEVDRIQHEKNLLIDDLPTVRFVYGGAEEIALPDASIDIVIMLKSLHHVPVELMDQALAEIQRVLKPGGIAYISEPVYAGDFNEIMKLFNDEQVVRQAAFAAICRAVGAGLFIDSDQIFFNAPGRYRDFADFDEQMLQVTHTQHNIDAALRRQIEAAFNRHMGDDGARFLRPSRVDLLRKP
ncbi:MAG: class I SAM-dependent methyltransferase [Proteobacteria bacterium]|nr:MAG: class I SAM-dependent methyltransferase [Pseudomonadota bacterium]QKK10348.1 MAG: class I SAM-dependent methyltransferase [Pseudomonadota bacterium]